MAWHRNCDALLSSSSGGVFSALAEYVFRRGGIVFGAAKDLDTWEVYHRSAEDADALEPLKLSKYYQSDVRDVYREAKANLEAGRFVLFTGTACQIAGLRSYLGNVDRERLITADVLCHGVASKKVIDGYVKSKERKFRKKIVNIAFRVKEKSVGWIAGGGTRMKITFADGGEYVSEKGFDTFFNGFNRNFFLRESCYRCKYCGQTRVSDFTLGDFWGCKPDRLPPEQAKMGVSLMLCNSKKAMAMLNELGEILEIRPIQPEEAVPHNRALSSPQPRPAIRDTFFADMNRKGFDRVVIGMQKKRYLKHWVKGILKRILPYSVARRIMKNV